MTTTIEARCTQCGSKEFGDPNHNNNTMTYDAKPHELKHGTGNSHGTEFFECPTCNEETVHNRCGKSVPTAQR